LVKRNITSSHGTLISITQSELPRFFLWLRAATKDDQVPQWLKILSTLKIHAQQEATFNPNENIKGGARAG
jgi:hypothetical protein